MGFEFNYHGALSGKHSILSPSKYTWANKEDAVFYDWYNSEAAKEYGTKQHALASMLIKMGQKLPQTRQTLNMFVNDSLKFDCSSEVTLFYSEFCFGAADAIRYLPDKHDLLVMDLKTGLKIAGHMEQLYIYSALFCLEYHIRPGDLKFTTRIYQFNEIREERPSVDEIAHLMDSIISKDKLIRDIRAAQGLDL